MLICTAALSLDVIRRLEAEHLCAKKYRIRIGSEQAIGGLPQVGHADQEAQKETPCVGGKGQEIHGAG